MIDPAHSCRFDWSPSDWRKYLVGIDHDEPRRCPATELPEPRYPLMVAGMVWDGYWPARHIEGNTERQDFLDAKLIIRSASNRWIMADVYAELQHNPGRARYDGEFAATYIADYDWTCLDWVEYFFLRWAYPMGIYDYPPSAHGHINYRYEGNIPECP